MALQAVSILLVDDNDDDIVLIKDALAESRLINVLDVAHDGEEAIDFLRRQGKYKDALEPGLVLLDINMPKKNGFEVLMEVKADPELKHIPIIMLTVSHRDEEVIKAYREGVCSFVRKPIDFCEFQRVVGQLSLYWALVATIPHGVRKES